MNSSRRPLKDYPPWPPPASLPPPCCMGSPAAERPRSIFASSGRSWTGAGTAIVLVPEIALTPQLLRSFTAQFGDAVAVLHSSLRAGERYDEWKRLRTGKARVAIGTRSAVFAPLKDLGLVILDEEQEATYKSENVPKYHARDVAKYRCTQSGALLVLGSATPSVESMYLARTGVYHCFTLSRRYNEQALPAVFIADMKEELARRKRDFSEPAPPAGPGGDPQGGGSRASCFSTAGGPSRHGLLRGVRSGAPPVPAVRCI